MCMRLRGFLFSALVIAVAAIDGPHAGSYPPPASPYAEVVSRSPATAAPAADDANPWGVENSRPGAGARRLGLTKVFSLPSGSGRIVPPPVVRSR